MMSSKIWLMSGAVFGFFGVALGAFGAHALKDHLSAQALTIYQTAVHYQMIHALSLIGLGLWSAQNPSVQTDIAGMGFIFGIVLFSGSLFILAISGIRAIGMITPIGGLAFLLGWLRLAYLVWRG